MKKSAIALLVLAMGALALGQLGCSAGSQGTAKLEMPKVYDKELATQYAQLGSDGYQLLEAQNFDSAIVVFEEQAALIPDGKWGQYNVACAYGRQGDVDNALMWLDSAAAHGFADPVQLEGDPDMEAVRADARYAALLAKVSATAAEKEKMFVDGLPRYDTPPEQFASQEALDQWLTEQRQVMQVNSRIWHNWERTAFGMDLEAKRLASMKALEGDSFDLDLERINAMARMKSVYDESWGSVSGTIMKEADAYLAAHPGTEGASEAAYRGLSAALKQYPMEDMTKPEGQAAMTKAAEYMAKIDADAKQYMPGEVWMMAGKLAAAGQNREQVYPELLELEPKFAADNSANKLARALMSEDLVRASWPIAINAVDIDGKKVSLDDYKGKVVMVDFWATWCGPCRGELPYIKDVYKKYHKDGFDILSISLDFPERTDQAKYREWIKENGMDWRHVYDEKNWDSPITASYYVGSIPSPFLIGRDGKLVAMHDECRGEDLEKVVRKALGMEQI